MSRPTNREAPTSPLAASRGVVTDRYPHPPTCPWHPLNAGARLSEYPPGCGFIPTCTCCAEREQSAFTAGQADMLVKVFSSRASSPFITPGKHGQNCRAFVVDDPAEPAFNECSCGRNAEWLAEAGKREADARAMAIVEACVRRVVEHGASCEFCTGGEYRDGLDGQTDHESSCPLVVGEFITKDGERRG
jgi:hypothetical protein